MEKSPIIRFRIDREIAESAHRMAAQKGLELPDIMRMMLTKAVRIGDFSIDQEQSDRTGAATAEQLKPYDPLYWSEAQAMFDADLALAILQQVVADRTTWLDEGLSVKVPDVDQLERIRNERDDACALLAAFDPKDAGTVAKIVERFAAASEADPTSGPSP